MRRGNRRVLLLAVVCLLGVACGTLPIPEPPGARAPDPATAIAFSVSGAAVYLVDPETGGRQTIAQGLSDFQSGSASWAPGHRRLAYGNGAILLANARTGKTRVLVRGHSLSMPAWSPDGLEMAYGEGTAMWRIAVQDPVPVRVPLPKWLAPFGIAWHPGRAIAFEGLRLDCSQPVGCSSTEMSEVWTVKPDGTGLRRITRAGHVEKPKWSPDGSRLLFVRRRLDKKGSPTELWAIKADGSGAKRLLPAQNVVAADWSPDGSEVVVVRGEREAGRLRVWIARSDGSGLAPVGGPISGTDAAVDW